VNVALVLTEGPGSARLERLYAAADEALRAGDQVVVFADVEGVKAMQGTQREEIHDLSVLQSRGANVMLCRFCTLRQGLDLDPVVLATARTGDMDDLSRILSWADRVVCP
jgi:hypothetical protein